MPTTHQIQATLANVQNKTHDSAKKSQVNKLTSANFADNKANVVMLASDSQETIDQDTNLLINAGLTPTDLGCNEPVQEIDLKCDNAQLFTCNYQFQNATPSVQTLQDVLNASCKLPSSSSNKDAIIGGAVGGAALLLSVLGCFLYKKKCKSIGQENERLVSPNDRYSGI